MTEAGRAWRLDHYYRKRDERLDAYAAALEFDPVPTPEDIVLQGEVVSRLETYLDQLPPRYGLAVRLFFGIRCEPHTYEEIGQLFGTARERPRQIVANSMRRLKFRMLQEFRPLEHARRQAQTAAFYKAQQERKAAEEHTFKLEVAVRRQQQANGVPIAPAKSIAPGGGEVVKPGVWDRDYLRRPRYNHGGFSVTRLGWDEERSYG